VRARALTVGYTMLDTELVALRGRIKFQMELFNLHIGQVTARAKAEPAGACAGLGNGCDGERDNRLAHKSPIGWLFGSHATCVVG
jgi:hypothetical protein